MGSIAPAWIQSTPWLNSIGNGSFSMNSASNLTAAIFKNELPSGEAITHVGFHYGSRTGTPPTYRISLQGVTSDAPDGTVKGGGSPASATFTPPADSTWNNTFQWVALDNPYSASVDELLALVIDHSSGTIDGSNFSAFNVWVTSWDGSVGYPFQTRSTNAGSSWTPEGVWGPNYGYKGATSVRGFVAIANAENAVGTSGHRFAAKFTMPTSLCRRYKIAGMRTRCETSGLFTWGVWDSAGTAMQSVSSRSRTNKILTTTMFPTQAILQAGVTYYIGIEHAGTSFWPLQWNVSAADDLKAFWGDGQFRVSTWNGSAWSDQLAVAPMRVFLSEVIGPADASFQLGI